MRTAIRRYMVLILLCIVRVPSVPAAISVSIPNMSGMQGSTVDIPVVVAGMLPSDSLVAYQLKIRFNATVLQISSATQNGTMTANWGSPFTSIKNDTVRIGGYTTNQPNKRIVQDDNILVKLRVLVIGYPGSQSSITISEIKFFHLTGEMQISGVTGGTFSVTQNPGAQDVDLNLYPSWNLISFPVVPTLGTLPEILQ
ncbi:MAG TPA: cohesin domain-containing protein, partial [bacterium]